MDYPFVRQKIRNAKQKIDKVIHIAETGNEFSKLTSSLQEEFFRYLKDAQRELNNAENHLTG